jgi:hypothetical protein
MQTARSLSAVTTRPTLPLAKPATTATPSTATAAAQPAKLKRAVTALLILAKPAITTALALMCFLLV